MSFVSIPVVGSGSRASVQLMLATLSSSSASWSIVGITEMSGRFGGGRGTRVSVLQNVDGWVEESVSWLTGAVTECL